MADDLFKEPSIMRLGKLSPKDRRLINQLHRDGKPPGYIGGYVTADRAFRRTKNERPARHDQGTKSGKEDRKDQQLPTGNSPACNEHTTETPSND